MPWLLYYRINTVSASVFAAPRTLLASGDGNADKAAMVALGCLLLLILPLLGFLGGAFLAGTPGGLWGAGAGFVLAVASCAFAGYALMQASRRK